MAYSDQPLPQLFDGVDETEFESVATTKKHFSEANGGISQRQEDFMTSNNESTSYFLPSSGFTSLAGSPVIAIDDRISLSSQQDNNSKTNESQNRESTFGTSATTNQNMESGEEKIKKNLTLAAMFIEDACLGRTLEYNNDEMSLYYYRAYSKIYYNWVTLFLLWWLLFLALFEEPAVSGADLPYWATMLMELLCLGVIAFRMRQLSLFVPRRALLTDPKNIVIALTLVITLIDMVIYIGMKESNTVSDKAIRVSRCLRPMFLINMNESRQVRRAFRNIRNTVPEIVNVLVLFIFSVTLFTLLAFKLFQYRDLYYRTGEPYFQDYWYSLWDLYVLVTTANSPDVMMPAYDDSPWFALFFIVYIIINTYIFINLFLAVIYNSYRAHLKTEIRSSVFWKRKKLEEAFHLLKESNNNPVVTSETWVKVMKHLTRPPSYAKINLYWEVLNEGKDRDMQDLAPVTIGIEEFRQVANLLNVYVVQGTTRENIFLRLAPEVYRSRPSQIIQDVVNHRYFAYAFDLLILANAVCIALDLEETEWFFLSVFMLEIALKMYTLGPVEYFSLDRLWNWFDFIIIMAAFIATIIEASLDELAGFPREALDFLLVLRCLRLVKIVGTIERFQTIVMTLLNIAPSLATYGVVLLMIYYAFAIVGMEAFGGKIKFFRNPEGPTEAACNNDLLIGTEFARFGYCQNNFNDILHSLVTLVELTVVNQWHVITLGHVKVTSEAARLYFISFHLIVVILIMNIIVAFVLEAFILEYSLSKTTIETKVERTIESIGLSVETNMSETYPSSSGIVNEPNTDGATEAKRRDFDQQGSKYKFRINKGHKNVEVLLQRMFEGELEGEVFNEENTVTLDGVTGSSINI